MGALEKCKTMVIFVLHLYGSFCRSGRDKNRTLNIGYLGGYIQFYSIELLILIGKEAPYTIFQTLHSRELSLWNV